MYYIKVKKEDAEKKIKELIKKELISKEYKIFKKENFVFVPVVKKIKGAIEIEGKKKENKRNLKEILRKKLSKEEIEKIKRAFDIIGDIAIVEIPEELINRKKIIGQAIMKINKRVHSVFMKKSPLKGVFRTREVEFICGENKKETIHKENGCVFKVNIEKVYFSPRLSYERKRIMELVKEGEKILAMFAGVGPFPIVIKKHKNVNIVAVELNPYAVKLMKENLKLNKINFKVIEGDVREYIKENYFDRILMPLPKDAELFLPYAFKNIKNNGVIHIYTFEEKEDAFKKAKEKIEKEAKKEKIKIKIINQRIVRPFSPSTVQVVTDFLVKK